MDVYLERGVKVEEFLTVKADRYTKACQNAYLNPHPVPPRTIAARRIAPAMDPIMILVPLGPAQRKEGGRVRRRRRRRSRNKTPPLKTHIRGQEHHTSTTSTQREKEKEAEGRVPEDRQRWRKRGGGGGGGMGR